MVAGADLRLATRCLQDTAKRLADLSRPLTKTVSACCASACALHHDGCGLFLAATQVEHRDERPYTLVCNPERDFNPYDRLRTHQSACVMMHLHQQAGRYSGYPNTSPSGYPLVFGTVRLPAYRVLARLLSARLLM